MIRWKVVHYDRSSISLPSYCKYRRIYKRGNTIKAEKESLGIFVFKTKKDAENFTIKYLKEAIDDFKMLKVNPVGRGKSPQYVADFSYPPIISEILETFYKQKTLKRKPPLGTICYPAVKVLE